MSVRELPSKAAPVTVSGKRVPEVTIMDKVTIFFFFGYYSKYFGVRGSAVA